MDNPGKISGAQAVIGEMDIRAEEGVRSFLGTLKNWKRILPVAVSCAILIYLFWYIDIRLCLSALWHAHMTVYVSSVIVLILTTFLLDTQNLAATLKHFHYPISWKNAFILRGVTYLIMTIDYSMGMGVLIYY